MTESPMLDVEIQNAIAQIHAAPHKFVLEFAGAGSLALWWMHSVAGSSKSIIEATDRYAAASLNDLLGKQSDQFVSVETAIAMAQRAYERVVQLEGKQRTSFYLGVACTATIATTYKKSGEHRCAIAVQSSEGITSYDLRMNKGQRDRAGEERLVSQLLVNAIGRACGLPTLLRLDMATGENLRENHMILNDPIQRLMFQTVQTVTIYPDGYQVVDHPTSGALLSGSFNPLHQGHESLAEAASAALGMPVVFELPIVNADKGTLTATEIEQRIQQFEQKHTLVLTQAPLFRDKAALFPGGVFVVGYDTAMRLVSPHYYGNETDMYAAMDAIRAEGCRFLVAGRLYNGRFYTLSSIPVPPEFKGMFAELTEEQFRIDISSTELRN